MPADAELVDYQWLTSPEAAPCLLRLAGQPATPALAAELRKEHSGARVHLLFEQAALRERAKAKFSQAERMFFTPLSLEQATDEATARYKAARFAAAAASRPTTTADLCCGIGGDLLALAAVGGSHPPAVYGVDRDPIKLLFAQANAAACLPAERRPRMFCQDVAWAGLPECQFWHVDPDRRSQGRRSTRLSEHEPGLDFVESQRGRCPHGAVKLAPAAHVPEAWRRECECQWISRGGECRQLVVWSGDLARRRGLSVATRTREVPRVADAGFAPVEPLGPDDEGATFAGLPGQSARIVEQAGAYIYDPDPALLAADLAGALAEQLGLAALAQRIGYLTGQANVAHPLLSAFAVEVVMALQPKRIAGWLQAHQIGQLEIKKRGVEYDIARLRREVLGEGDQAAVLFVTRLGGKPRAILARRVEAQ